MVHKLVPDLSRGESLPRCENERNAYGFLEHVQRPRGVPLAEQTVVTRVQAVVGGIDDERILEFSPSFERVDKSPDRLVYFRHRGVVLGLKLSPIGFLSVQALSGKGAEAVALAVGYVLEGAVPVGVYKAFGVICVGRMGSNRPYEGEKGPAVRVVFLKKAYSGARGTVCLISPFLVNRAVVDISLQALVGAGASAYAEPFFESWSRYFGHAAVPFAKKSAAVADAREELSEKNLVFEPRRVPVRSMAEIIVHAVLGRIPPRPEGRASG